MERQGFALVVFTFDEENEARSALDALRNLEKAGRLSIDDSAVIRRGEDGKIHVDNKIDSSVKGGAAIGGMLGLIIGGLLFPIGGLILGVAGGAAIGKMMETGVDKKFVEDVSNSLQPGSSALFVTSNGGDPSGRGRGAAAVQGNGLPHEPLQRGRAVAALRSGLTYDGGAKSGDCNNTCSRFVLPGTSSSNRNRGTRMRSWRCDRLFAAQRVRCGAQIPSLRATPPRMNQPAGYPDNPR